MLSHRLFSSFLLAGSLLLFVAGPSQLLAQNSVNSLDKATPNFVKSPGIDIKGETDICQGTETILEVDGGEFESYEWSDGSKERFIKVKEAGIYHVTVKTKGGCTFSASVNVRVRPCA